MGGKYAALTDSSGAQFPFLDTDVYKWLEAVGWELGRGADPALEAMADEAIAIVAAAQRATATSTATSRCWAAGRRSRTSQWGHELYCIGHLIQAADRLAAARSATGGCSRSRCGRPTPSTGRSGPGRATAIDGHPEIEMALVELWRETGERRYLTLATRQIDLRGHGLLGEGRFGPEYWQDHLPVREAPDGRRARGAPAVPRRRARSTSPSRPATRRCSTR